MLLLLLLACEEKPSQATLFARALQEGASLCTQLQDPDARGPCVVAAVEKTAREDIDAAQELCASLQDPWLEECMFRSADAARATGPVAMQLCGRAGRYVAQCLGHAAAREAEVLFRSPGHEVEALSRLTDLCRGFRGERKAVYEARHLAAQAMASRSPSTPFSIGLCGEADAELCQLVYIKRATKGASRQQICADPSLWPAFTEDARALVEDAQRDWCAPSP